MVFAFKSPVKWNPDRSLFPRGRVAPALLRPSDLPLFSEARIVNAMISIGNSPVIPINKIAAFISNNIKME